MAAPAGFAGAAPAPHGPPVATLVAVAAAGAAAGWLLDAAARRWLGVRWTARGGRWRAALGPMVTAGLWAAVAASGPPRAVDLVGGCALACLCAAATATDLETRLIPNRLTGAAALLWLALAPWAPHPGGDLLGALAFGGVLAAPALLWPGGMGWGDVKLAAVAGLYLGWRLVPVALALTAVAGALAAGVQILRGRRGAFAYGPCLALGSMLALLAGGALEGWYLSLGR